MRPEGATVVVTGAARGIGAASALQLAEDGWNVAVNFRSDGAGAEGVVEQIRAAGGRAMAFGADVLDDAAWDEALPRVAEELGPVLALVNNAGITADGLALQLSDEDWDSVVATNLTAAFRLSRRALRPMIRARYGRLVNIASVVGPRANAGQANYAASKAGLIGLTKTMAHEVARRGVTINAVAPGFIETEMTKDVLSDGTLEAIPARRAGRPEEVGACVAFLCSDRAGYVTGSTLYVDGGMSA